MSNKDSPCIIFGGSSGIGLSIANFLISKEIKVISVSRNHSKLKSNNLLTNIKLDLFGDSEEIINCFERNKNKFINPYAIIYSVANPCNFKSLIEIPDKAFIDSFKISTLGLHIYLSWLISSFKNIKQKNKLNVIVISSQSANKRSPYSSAEYSVSKAAQLSISRYYSFYLQEKNLGRLNILTPGLVNTPLSKNVLGESFLEKNNYLKTSDLHSTIDFLLNDTNISGSEISVSGGFDTTF